MAFKSAGSLAYSAGGSADLSVTVQSGVTATDTVLILFAYGTATIFSASVTVPPGATSQVLIPMRKDNNLSWTLIAVTGVVTGDVVTITLSSSSWNTVAQAFAFDQPVGLVGTIGNRGGVSGSSTVAPGLAGLPVGTPTLMLALERTLANPTTVNSVVSSTSEAVTQLSYTERVGDPDISFYLGRFVPTTSPTGSTTITYSSSSGNAGAVLIAEQTTEPTTPSASPSFGNQSGIFNTGVSIPGAPVAYKASSPMVTSSAGASLTVPSGTLVSDYVYIVTTWGSADVHPVNVIEPVAQLPAATVVPVLSSGNMSWNIQSLTGLVGGDVIKVDVPGGVTPNVAAKLFVFDGKLGAAGAVGRRSGASSVTTTIPGVAVAPGSPVYLFSFDRTLAANTAVTNAVNANGYDVTQLVFEELANDPAVSIYLGRYVSTAANSGDTTLTYNMSAQSPNSSGVAIPVTAALPNAQPVFGNSKGTFSIRVTPPNGLIRANLGRPDESHIRVKTYTQGATTLRLVLSTSPDMSAPIYSNTLAPDSAGYTALEVSGLLPDTDLYWQIELNGVMAGTTNSCRTWPTPGNILPVAGIIISSCTKAFGSSLNGPSNPPTFQYMAARTDAAGNKARLFIDLGDDFYPHTTSSPLGSVVPPSEQVVRNYWEAQHGQPQRTEFHKNIPTSHTYSDNDFTGSNSDSTMAPESAAVVNRVRRQVLSDGPFGSTDGKGLYWSYLLGRTLIIQTDSRTYATDNMAPNSTPGKSMLGPDQKAWLKTQFTRPDAKAIIWCHDNQWIGPPGVSSSRPAVDNWQTYATERQELADFIVANNVPLLLYAHGDNHTLMFDDGTNNPYGGFPYAMCAPIFQDSGLWTGTNTGGTYGPGSNSQLYTWVEITDSGTEIAARVQGIDTATGASVVKLDNLVTLVVDNVPIVRRMQEFFGTIKEGGG